MPFDPHRKARLLNNGRRRQPVAIPSAVAILAVTALVCAVLVAVSLWTALVGNWQVDAISDPCGVKPQPARQDCLRELGLGEPRHPAKGATAPIRVYPREPRGG